MSSYTNSITRSIPESSSNDSIALNYQINFAYNRENLDLLLSLLHSSQCLQHFCTVLLSKCSMTRDLFYHSKRCKNDYCDFYQCNIARKLLRHYSKCQDIDCKFCLPARLCLRIRNVYTKPRRRGIVIEEFTKEDLCIKAHSSVNIDDNKDFS